MYIYMTYGWVSLSLVVSTAAILFWLNCKSVYSYWQHQRKLLNEEVHIYMHVQL